MISFINDQGAEIQLEEDLLITKQVASFKTFKIKGDISVSFDVENNSANRKTLGYYGFAQINSPVFSSTPFNLVKNGNILMRGLMVIEEDTGETLSLYFISGNSDWFKAFNFNCREIRTNRYSTTWDTNSISNSLNKSEGIVFPFIDWVYQGYKGDKYLNLDTVSGFGDSLNDVFPVCDSFPCLFVHTLLDEIAIQAGVKIDGNIFDDKFFKTLIITPDKPDIVDPETESVINTTAFGSATVKVQAVAPNMTALDVIKWVCVSFSIVPVFDTFSQTLTLDLLDRKKLEDAKDWSQYVQDYNIKYDQTQHKYIRITQPDDATLADYNSVNDVQYGELDIQSDKLDGQGEDVYTSPFAPSVDIPQSGPLEFSLPYIPMYVLQDDQEYEYTSVTQKGIVLPTSTDIYMQINGAGFPFTSSNAGTYLLRFADDLDGISYNRMWKYFADSFPSNTAFTIYQGTDTFSTGTFYTQSISKGTPGNRVLSFISSIPVSSVSTLTGATSNLKLTEGDPNRSGTKYNQLTNVPTAYYHKQFTYSSLNAYRQGLAYGPISGHTDYSLSDNYFRYLKGMVTGPTIRTNMLLPEKEFIDFNFEFVYLNTGRLNGYFFVDSIVNYKDATTPVEVNLLQIQRDEQIVNQVLSAYTLTAASRQFNLTGQAVNFTYDPYMVRIYLSSEEVLTSDVKIQYKKNLETVTTTTVTASTSPTLITTLYLNPGGSVYVNMRSMSNAYITFGAANSSPAPSTGYCGKNGYTQTNINSATDIYINVASFDGDVITC